MYVLMEVVMSGISVLFQVRVTKAVTPEMRRFPMVSPPPARPRVLSFLHSLCARD
jgi:hypothetical protein